MLDKFTYTNSFNETLEFGKDCLFVNENDLRDFAWEITSKNNKISSFKKGIVSKTIPVILKCDSEADGVDLRNRLFEVFEKDIVAKKHGKIQIGDYYLKCFITGSKKTQYLIHKNYMVVTLTVQTDIPVWIKETTTSHNVSVVGEHTEVLGVDGHWYNDAYRVVDFGETQQSVSSDFYTWFTSNASNSNPVMLADVTDATDLKNTMWTFNEVLTGIPYDDPDGGTLYSISFTHNGASYETLVFYYDATNTTVDKMSLLTSEARIFELYADGQWMVDNRTITITGGHATTDETLMAWLMQNATKGNVPTPTPTPTPTYTLSGVWTFHEQVDVKLSETLWGDIIFTSMGKTYKEIRIHGGIMDYGAAWQPYLDFPYEFPHDFKNPITQSSIHNGGFTPSNFIMTIFGAVTNPTLYLGNHKYSVKVTLEPNDYLTIDSINKTIILNKNNGTLVNCFNERVKDSYIFEKIPCGSAKVTSPNSQLRFDLTLLEERGEPKWT